MPQLIEHIDAIARKKSRSVLYVTFRDPASERTVPILGAESERSALKSPTRLDWKHLPVREKVIAWLDGNGVAWQPCGDIANPNLMLPYEGQIYVDVPFDEKSPGYQKLSSFLEYPDGTMRLPGVFFWCLPLDVAMKNAHHDEPGFWDKWAEAY